MTQSLTYVEIDVPHCANVYGFSPCTASLTSSPPTGTIKCFNSRQTCQDIANYVVDDPVTFRFAVPTSYLPREIFAIPSISEVQVTPAVVSLGKDLGQRASVSIIFEDHPDDDTTPGIDPYLSTRTYNPFLQGTFWGKFRARNPFIIGSKLRLIFGSLGQDLADMETRHYIIDSYEGPTPRGKFTIRASDALKLSDTEKAQAPLPSNGFLSADITAVQNTAALLPSGVGAEYPGGYLNIGGSEIVRYWVRGDEEENVLLLHFDDQTDAATVFTDSSASVHVFTGFGNAQIDTAVKQFGNGSLLLDGAGDYIRGDGSSDFALGTGDFTIDFWFRKVVNNAGGYLYDGRSATGVVSQLIYHGGDNSIRYAVAGTDRIVSSINVTTTGVFYHIAVCRQSGVTKMFLNGVQQGSNYTDANDYVVSANRPVLGIFGPDLTTGPHNGWIDEVRVTKGFARWFANFTAPTAKTPTGSDILQLSARGQLNTVAATHNAQDRAQHVLSYVSDDPADIVYDLCTNYLPGFDASWIDLPTWRTETLTYNGNTYTGYITEPTSVKTLLEELISQAALVLWWDDIGEQMRLQVLHAISTSAQDFTPDNMRRGSLSIIEQLDTRISQALIYFGQLNPLLPLSNKDNYRASTLVEDTTSEDNWGQPAITTVLSRWIPQAGRTVADRLGAIILGRYKTPPRRVSFEVQRYAETDPELGAGYHFLCDFVQDDTGADTFLPIQVTQLKPTGDAYAVQAEEMLFDAPAADLTNRQVTFTANAFNLNLRNEHDSIYPVPTGSETVTFTINIGVLIGSTSAINPSVIVGTWPAGTVINLAIIGRIEGMGGAGGAGFPGGGNGGAGNTGGTALFTRKAINLTYTSGAIWSGGGGGGAGALFGSGGGGGGGKNPGAGGAPSSGSAVAGPGSPGTETAGGAGGPLTGSGGAGGTGGAPGFAGSVGGTFGFTYFPGSGGAIGAAIDGISFVTVVGGAGDLKGSTIN